MHTARSSRLTAPPVGMGSTAEEAAPEQGCPGGMYTEAPRSLGPYAIYQLSVLRRPQGGLGVDAQRRLPLTPDLSEAALRCCAPPGGSCFPKPIFSCLPQNELRSNSSER